MNSEIESIFKDFVVDGTSIPIEFLKYTGKSTTYLTYCSLGEEPLSASDDEITDGLIQYDIDIYSKGNYLNIIKEVKKKMKENNFMWTGDSLDMYEEDTNYYHKTVSFEKERSVI